MDNNKEGVETGEGGEEDWDGGWWGGKRQKPVIEQQ